MTLADQRITTFLMFSGQAEEAMKFYVSLFDEAQIESIFHQEDGTVMHATFTLNGQTFMAIDNAKGEHIPFTAAMSLFVTCETEREIDYIFSKLTEEGRILMDLAATPFSVKFGWVEDRYGVSWQLNLERVAD